MNKTVNKLINRFLCYVLVTIITLNTVLNKSEIAILISIILTLFLIFLTYQSVIIESLDDLTEFYSALKELEERNRTNELEVERLKEELKKVEETKVKV